MKKNLELVVLDMAGTTVDEQNVVYKTIHATLEDNGYSYSLGTVLEHCAGKEKRTAIKDLLRETNVENVSDQLVNDLFVQFKKNLTSAYDVLEVNTFDGTLGFLEQLKRSSIAIALNTGYDKVTATGLIDKLNWKQGQHFDVLVTADDVKNGRPHPDMIHLAMEKTHVTDASRVMKIGDSVIDIQEGQSANCGYSVGVTTGAHSRASLEKAKPTFVIDNLNEIFAHLE